MHYLYDRTEDQHVDPIIDFADAAGLYHPDAAASAARASLTDLGSGNWRTDD